MDNTYEHSFIDSNFLESAYTAFLPMDANEDCFMAPGASSTRFMQLHSSLVNPAAIMGNIPTITSIQMHAISPNACPTIKQEPVENVQQQIRREVQESSTPSESYESQERSETPERKKRAAPKTGANEDAVGGDEVKEVKKLRRKEANKEAARRSREKKDKERKELRDTVVQLQSHLDILAEENRTLKSELQEMRSQMQKQQQPMFSAMPFIPVRNEYNQPFHKLVTSYGVLFLMVFSVTLLVTPGDGGFSTTFSSVFRGSNNMLMIDPAAIGNVEPASSIPRPVLSTIQSTNDVPSTPSTVHTGADDDGMQI